MPKKITAYQASDGTIYDNECAAATRDVMLLVEASPLNENAPYAKKLITWLTENSKAIRSVLATHEAACPTMTVAKPFSESSTGPDTQDPDQPHLNGCGFHKGAACDCGAEDPR